MIVYFVLFNSFGGFSYLEATLFSTSDSQEYQGYAAWMFGNSDYCNPNRSYLYPFLIGLAGMFSKVSGIWFMQFLMWLGGCILVYAAALRISAGKTVSIIALIISASSFSLMVYTHHALTEVAAFFTLASLIFCLSGDLRNPKQIIWSVFICGALAAIKPQFQPLWYLHAVAAVLFLRKEIFRKPLLILAAAASFAPVLIQFAINKAEHNSFSNSAIASYNLRNSVYKKVLFYSEGNSFSAERNFDQLPDSVHDAINKAVLLPADSEIKSYLLDHKSIFLKVWGENVLENLQSGNPYISDETHHSLNKWVSNFNHNILFGLHCLCLLLWIWFLLANFKKRDAIYFFIFLAGAIFYYAVATCGTVYWAGDRLLVSSVAVWAVVYPLLISRIVRKK